MTSGSDTLVSPLAPKGGFPDLPVVDGVKFATIEAGGHYKDRDDVMLAELAPGTEIAGMFTTSATRAAPVLDCQAKLGGPATGGAAFLVNAGNANAFTGSYGVRSVEALTQSVATLLGISPDRVFSASTGVIGQPLAHDNIIGKLEQLKSNLTADNAHAAAHAIMTTDTFAKGAAVDVSLGGEPVQIVGFAKGSGMIAPDMATMLVYIFTDAKVDGAVLQSLLSDLTQKTFNRITVDSDTSTSDTVLLAATGKSNAEKITDASSQNGAAFAQALHKLMLNLAHQVVRDGEGATKFVEIAVSGAASNEDAHKVAMAVANSPLVKTAIAGEDPNWGRIVMAVGKSGAAADRDRLSIRFGDILVAEHGWVAASYSEEQGLACMKEQEISIVIDMGIGEGHAVAWTCDLTHRYIEINADYRS